MAFLIEKSYHRNVIVFIFDGNVKNFKIDVSEDVFTLELPKEL